MEKQQSKWYLEKFSSTSLELQVRRLLDIIGMNQGYSTVPTEVLIEELRVVRDMDMSRVQS